MFYGITLKQHCTFLILLLTVCIAASAKNFYNYQMYYDYQPYEIRNKTVNLRGQIRLDCIAHPEDRGRLDNFNEFTWYTGVQSMDKKALDKETRKAIIIVVQDGQNAIIDNYARKFPHNLRYHYRVDINTSPTTNGDLIIVDANKDVEGLYGCCYGPSNTESPISYYVTVTEGLASNQKLTNGSTYFSPFYTFNFLQISKTGLLTLLIYFYMQRRWLHE